MDEERPPPRPRYGVYPLVGDQCQFDDPLYRGDDKVAATLAAKRNIKAHPLGVILLNWRTGTGLVWRDWPPLNGKRVQLQVYMPDVERHFKDWAERYLRQHRQ